MNDLAQCDAIRELITERKIQRLHSRYAQLCDSGYPAQEIADLFTENGIWEARPQGAKYIGRQQIRDHFASADASYPWALHLNIPLQIDVAPNGQSACGTWYLFMPCTDATTGTLASAWLAGRYDNNFVSTDDGWKYSHLRITFGLMTPHLNDWSGDRFDLLTRLNASGPSGRPDDSRHPHQINNSH